MQDLGFSFGISLAFNGLKELAKSTEGLKSFTAKLDQSSKSVKALNKNIEALDKSKAKIKEVGESFNAMKGELFGKVAASAAIVAPVKISANVEDAMLKINQYLGLGNEELSSLRSSFLALSADMKTPVNEVLSFAELASSLGLRTQKDILAFSKLGSQYQKVFALSSEEAGVFMGKLSNIYKLNTNEMSALGDKIINVAKKSAVSASTIAKVMNEVGGDAKLIGMNAEQSAALSAALVGASKDEGEAASSFKAMVSLFSNLGNASEDMQNQFLKLGMNTQQMSAYFKQDGAEAIKVFLNQLKTLPQDEMTEFLNSVFGGSAGIMQNLVDNTDKYEAALKSLKDTKLGSLNKEFNTFNSSTNSNLNALMNSIQNLSATLGEALAPALNLIVNALTKCINFVRSFIEAFPVLSSVIGTAVVAIVATTVALSALKVGFLVAKLAAAQFAFTLNALKIAFNLLKIAFLSNPIGLILMAIVAVAALVIMNWDKVKSFFTNFISNISSAFSKLGDFFYELWGGVFEWFASKFEWLGKVFDKIKDVAKSVASFLGFTDDEEKEEKKKKEQISNKTPAKKQESEVIFTQNQQSASVQKVSEVRVNVSGTFNISSNDGVFDLNDFAKAIETSVLNALHKNDEKQKQTTIWG